eukprot:6202324-Pleurochrysis_carterae.AAC.1
MEASSLAAVNEFMECGILRGEAVGLSFILSGKEDMVRLVMELLDPKHIFYVGTNVHENILALHAQEIAAFCGREFVAHYMRLLHEMKDKEAMIWQASKTHGKHAIDPISSSYHFPC